MSLHVDVGTYLVDVSKAYIAPLTKRASEDKGAQADQRLCYLLPR